MCGVDGVSFVESLPQLSRGKNRPGVGCGSRSPHISATLNPLTSPSNHVSLHEEGGQMQDIDNMFARSFRPMPPCGDGERKIRNLLSTLSRRGQPACEISRSPYLIVVVHYIGQVPVGVLPVGHPSSMHAIEYSESSERSADHSG